MTAEERFMSKVYPEPNTGCWLWGGGYYPDDYPGFNDGGPVRAHRWAYEHWVGPIPEGMFVCHRCDTPACVNPHHLFAGTPRDNVQDALAKGRAYIPDGRGEGNGKARLTESDVRAIRAEFAKGVPRGWKRRTADRYGVQEAAIGKITRRVTWRHVA